MHLLVENLHIVQAVPPAASVAGTEDYVSLKGWDHVTCIIQVDNATSVTGATVTLLQAPVVAGTSEKPLSFSHVYANADTGASDTLTKTAVTSDTFDTATTANKNLLYVIEVPAASLDVANSFDCFRVDLTGNANCVISASYILSRGRWKGGLPRVSAITD